MINNLENKQTMAENIERFLLESALTRKDLSKMMNVPYTTICDWINGNTYPRIDKIEKMAQIFGVTKSDLVEEKSAKERHDITFDDFQYALHGVIRELDDEDKEELLRNARRLSEAAKWRKQNDKV